MNLYDTVIHEDMQYIYDHPLEWTRLSNCNVLVTGANGMIASYLIYYFIFLNEEKNFDINIYALSRKKEKAIDRFGKYVEKPYFHIIEANVEDGVKDDIEFDYVIHAASLASPQFYGVKPVETMVPNVVGTYKLLEKIKNSNVKSFLFFSSGSIYGNIKEIDKIEENNIGILNYLELGNCYGESKRCGEAICNAYFQEYSVPTQVVRIHHTYGPNMDYKNDKRVFAEFVKNAVEGNDIVMKSDGSDKRAFCYISDMITAFFYIILKGKSGEIYNVLNDEQYHSIIELANCIVNLESNRNIKLVRQNRSEKENYCASGVKRKIRVNCDKLKALGWKPSVSMECGFKRTIDYILSNNMNGDCYGK